MDRALTAAIRLPRILLGALLACAACRDVDREPAPIGSPTLSTSAAQPEVDEASHEASVPGAISWVTGHPVPAALEGRLVRPEAIHRPPPDWSRFPGGHLPGSGGVYSLRIDEAGNVAAVRALRAGSPEVSAVVMEALRQWRFRPATLDGKPVAVDYTISVGIHLR